MSQRKLAIFVEGQTERIFLENLIREIAGTKEITFSPAVVRGEHIAILSESVPKSSTRSTPYFVLLVDCQNDERVKTVVLEQRKYLANRDYSLILGLRDLYPTPLSDLQKIKSKLAYGVPTAGVPTHILLAVAEVEAWFLQEHTHFQRIDEALDVSKFKANFGFDPRAESAETVEPPAALLHRIYSSVGKAYRKDRKRVERTVAALDFAEVYLNNQNCLPHLKDLIAHIDKFLERPPEGALEVA